MIGSKVFFHCYKLMVSLVCILLFGTCCLGCQPISKETTNNEVEVTVPGLTPDEEAPKNNAYDLMWEFKISGTGNINTPVIVGDNVVFSINYGTNYSMVYALDKETSELQWHKSMDFRTLSHTVTSGNTVFFESVGVCVAIDADTGKIRWKYEPEEWGVFTPSICNDQIVIAVLKRATYVEYQDEIIAFDITTGEVKWRNRVNAALITTKIPAITQGMILVGTTNWMGALDIETGKEVWKVPTNRFYVYPLTNPGINDEIVCFIVDKSNKLLALEVLTGEEKWQVNLQESRFFSDSPTILGAKYLYLQSFNRVNHKDGYSIQGEKFLVVIDAKTGEVLQEYDGESYRGAPVAQDDHFLYLLFQDRIHALMKQNSKLEPVWSFRSRNTIYSLLLLEKDILYFGAGNTLYAVRNLIDPDTYQETLDSDSTSSKKQDPAIVFSYSSEKVFDDTSRNIVIDPAGNRNFDGRMFFGKDRILFSLHQQQSDSLIHTDYEGDDEHIVIDSRRTVLFTRKVSLYEDRIFFSIGFSKAANPGENSIIKLPLNYTDDDPSQGEWDVFHDVIAPQFFIHEGWMYYSNRQGLYKKAMSSGKSYLLANDIAFSINLLGEWLYYIRSSDKHVVKVRTDGSDYQSIINKETSCLTLDDQHLYFLDNNSHLCRSNHAGKDVKTIVAEAVQGFNISDQWIYYQNKNQPWDLIRTRKKGTESQKILLNGGAFLNTFTDVDTAYVIADINEIEYSDTGIYRISDDGAIELFYPKLSSSTSNEKVSIETIKESFEIEAESENTKKVVDANFEDKANPKDEASPLTVLYFLAPALGILIALGILWVKRRKQ